MSRGRLPGHFRDSVIDQVVDHQTPALVRQVRKPAVGKPRQLERRDLSSREVPGELEGIICIIWVEGGRSVRQGPRVRLHDERIRLTDFLLEFRELLYLRFPEKKFQFCRPRLTLRPDDQCLVLRRIEGQFPSSRPPTRHSGYIIVSGQCPISTIAYDLS